MMLQTLKTGINSKILFFLITTALILGLSITPLIAHTQNTPNDRMFTFIHNNTQDFFFYQSLMNQGANGKWLTRDSYTSEDHEPSLIFSYFLIFGKISNLLNVPYPVMYHLIRIIFAVGFFFSAYLLIFSFSVPYPRLTYLLFLFAAPFLHEVNSFGTIQNVGYMHWWTGIDPIRRAAYLPHHMIGAFLLILSLMLVVKYMKNPKRGYIIWLSAVAVLLAFVHTPSLFIILLIVPPAVGIKVLTSWRTEIKKYWGLAVYWCTGILVLLCMISQTSKGFPWSQYIDWEKNLQFPIQNEILGALGILFPLAIIGIIVALRSQKFPYILTACWLVVPLLLLPLAPILQISNIRLIQGVPFLPLAILAILGMKKVGEILILAIRRIPQTKNSKIKNWQIVTAWYTLVLIVFFVFTIPTIIWSVTDQIREFMPLYGNVYLDKRLNDAFIYMNKNLPPQTVTISTFYTGNYLPAYTNTTSYIGHSGYTSNLTIKEPKVINFFKGNMTEESAKKFLDSEGITVVFQGPEEKGLSRGTLYPKILIPVFQNDVVVVYRKI